MSESENQFSPSALDALRAEIASLREGQDQSRRDAEAAGRAALEEAEARRLQGETEGVLVDKDGNPLAHPDTVTYVGREYRLGPGVNLMALMKFADSASGSEETNGGMAGLAAMYALCRSVIHEDDWDEFERAALANRTDDGAELMGTVQEAIERITARPTTSPSGSSAGSPKTSESSKGDSSSQAPLRQPPTAGMVSVADLTQHRAAR